MTTRLALKLCAIAAVFHPTGCSAIDSKEMESNPVEMVSSPKIWHEAMASTNLMPFIEDGPYKIREIRNHDFRLGVDHSIKINIAIPMGVESAPLVIVQHGNMSFKEAHLDQIQRLATWGFVAITPQLPNFGQWLRNGGELKSMVDLIYKWPKLISTRVDPKKIILIGHSFGGSAVSLAAAKGAPIAGLILLDPAVYSRNVLRALPNIKVPTYVLAADPKYFFARKRPSFFASISSLVTELVISDTTHDDAQKPSLNSLRFFGFDPTTTEEGQARFLNSIVTAAISIAEPNLLPASWNSFRKGMRSGIYIEAKRK